MCTCSIVILIRRCGIYNDIRQFLVKLQSWLNKPFLGKIRWRYINCHRKISPEKAATTESPHLPIITYR